MYDGVLVPTDGSTDAERGVQHGVDLAAEVDATVHALYVIEQGGNPWRSESMEQQQEEAREYGEEILEDAAEMADEAGVDLQSATKIGSNVHEEINEYVEEEGLDVIVMGAGYYGRMGGILGSTADKIVRTSDVPVLVLRGSGTE